MKQRPRIYYTAAQKALMWDRWKASGTLHEIGKLFDRPHTSIHTILSATDGIRLPARHRSRLVLTMPEREEIAGRLQREAIQLLAGLTLWLTDLSPSWIPRRRLLGWVRSLFAKSAGAALRPLISHLHQMRLSRKQHLYFAQGLEAKTTDTEEPIRVFLHNFLDC